jgi:hypothetical protein
MSTVYRYTREWGVALAARSIALVIAPSLVGSSLVAPAVWAQEAQVAPAATTDGSSTPAGNTPGEDVGEGVGDVAAAAGSASSSEGMPDDATRLALRGLLERYVMAFNGANTEDLSKCWTSGASHVDRSTNERVIGRDAITARFKGLFDAAPGATLTAQPDDVRAILPNVVLVDGHASVRVASLPASQTLFTAVCVKEGDQWLISSVEESPRMTPPTPYDSLQPLEWLIGNWETRSDASAVADEEGNVPEEAGPAPMVVQTSFQWGPNRSFLLRTFFVQSANEPPYDGTQVIGWDPIAQQIRSWTFNSDGSFGEATWSRNGDAWLARTRTVLSSGQLATATQVVTRIGEDAIEVQTIGQEVDGQTLPATPAVVVHRADPTDEGAAPAELPSSPEKNAPPAASRNAGNAIEQGAK